MSAVVIDYMGINVAEADAMRKKLREANVDYTVYKNTLIKRAIEGTDYAPLAEVLDGPSAIAISTEDATAPARTLNEIIKQYKKMEFKAHCEVYGKHSVTGWQICQNSGGYCRGKGSIRIACLFRPRQWECVPDVRRIISNVMK